MKAITITAVIGVFLATAATALALREEMFGNAPFPSRPGWAAGVVDVVNLDSRIWLQEHALAGTVICFYKGDMHAVNLALRKFAAVKAGERPLVLLPGPGKPSLSSKPIEGDWQVLSSSMPYEKKDAHTFTFTAKVPGRGETKITYRVRVKWC